MKTMNSGISKTKTAWSVTNMLNKGWSTYTDKDISTSNVKEQEEKK